MLTKTRSVLAVHNLGVSVPYYRDVLGMKIDLEVPGWCFLSRNNFAQMLGECPHSMAAHELGDYSYFAYVTVSDTSGLFQEFGARTSYRRSHVGVASGRFKPRRAADT